MDTGWLRAEGTMRALVFLSLFLVSAFAKHEIYNGYTLYQVTVKSIDQVKLVNDVVSTLDLDIWSYAVPGRAGTILVDAANKEIFENELINAGVEIKIETENIQELLEQEEKLLAQASRTPLNGSRVEPLPFDRIYTYEEVNTFLEQLAEAYSETVTLVTAGQSFEGRDINYLKISTTNFEDDSKPIVYMESLLHAREWITLPATLYAIHKLVLDVSEQDLLQDIDWIIVPVANPDGYVFSHVQTRLWRKNRATGYGSCIGVDLNRNFDVDWSQASSSSVCSETFHGRAPFSEPESSVIREIILEYRDRLELFLDIHSFGGMLLYGYGMGNLPPNGLYLNLLAVRMAQAIDAVKWPINPNYVVGNVALVLYRASGSAMDYGQAFAAPFSYTFELPGRRGGGSGFLVDPDFIEQAGFETWEGIKVGARYVRDNNRRRYLN